MKETHKWIIGILLEHLILAVILGALWGSMVTKVENIIKQADKTEQTVNKIYDLMLGN